MAKLSCFPALLPGKRNKKTRKIADANKANGNECPKVKPVEFIDHATLAAAGIVKVVPAAHPVPVPVEDRDNKEADADQLVSAKGSDLSDFDFQFRAAKKPILRSDSDVALDTAVAEAADDPSPKLKRSCSNIETKQPGSRGAPDMPARSRSYGDLGTLIPGLALYTTATPHGAPEASPASVKTADRVMLKKRSSSQVLPSRSRKLWWRLFLWSHRNLHMPPRSARAAHHHQACSPGRHGGYTSDTFEEGPAADRKNKKVMVDDSPPPSVPNQWVAFSADNSIHDRIRAWVSSIESEPQFDIADEDDNYDGEDDEEHGGECASERPRHLELGEPSSGKGKSKRCIEADEVVQDNTIVQSLNAFSSVAHISGMGLKVVPMTAPFSTLRAVNLSSNFIVHISPGSLPKGLHSLDLSRNKIANIEGLRELTKLRVLNLSYNRISRIGHGLSNCTAIRELYLAGNKISDVEGLHRLLKLAVLDLSFNKITTAKALGQLVAKANYHSLLALNLVGNPVQVGDDALRRAVTGLLPSLAYLNKQPVKPQRSAREVATGSRSSRKKTSRRLTQSPLVVVDQDPWRRQRRLAHTKKPISSSLTGAGNQLHACWPSLERMSTTIRHGNKVMKVKLIGGGTNQSMM